VPTSRRSNGVIKKSHKLPFENRLDQWQTRWAMALRIGPAEYRHNFFPAGLGLPSSYFENSGNSEISALSPIASSAI
jgi:hypothetical protein